MFVEWKLLFCHGQWEVGLIQSVTEDTDARSYEDPRNPRRPRVGLGHRCSTRLWQEVTIGHRSSTRIWQKWPSASVEHCWTTDVQRWPTIAPRFCQRGDKGSECPEVPEDVQGLPRVNRVYRGFARVSEAVQGSVRLYEDLHDAGSTFSSNIYAGSTFSSSIYAGSTFKTLVQPR